MQIGLGDRPLFEEKRTYGNQAIRSDHVSVRRDV